MRSASSTCEGIPDDRRPATYLTSGEYATTRRSRARWSAESLYRRQRSLSSIALTFVSISSGPGVTREVGRSQPGGLYTRVHLRRGHAGVAEKLLDRAQVGAALEEVGGEGMAQRVRRHGCGQAGPPRPRLEPPSHVGGGEPPSRLRQEEGGLGARPPREHGAASREPGFEGAERGLAGGHEAGLRALALDTHRLL